jgi:S-DNA-T family DNA segregation ATPase FtsK/SpoIIIE
LQRRLRLGYGRAARILDLMEQEGLVGPPQGSRPRDVLVSRDRVPSE